MDPKCDICENVFNSKQKLKKHMTTVHENHEKVFNCNICTKKFRTKKGFMNHTMIFHGAKDFKCESCEKSFTSSGYLKKHIHTVHEEHKDSKC